MSIVEEIRQDREKGARRLQSEYKAGLLTLARRFCADESDAEELVNRTFAEVVANIDGYLEQSAFFGWMSRILMNIRNKDVRRKENSMVSCVADLPDEALDEEACKRMFNEVDSGIVREIIEGLPSDMKSAIVMHYFMDMPVKEIARVLLVPTGTVKWRLHCARQAITAKLGATVKSSAVKKMLAVGIAAVVLSLVGFAAAMVIKAAAEDIEEPVAPEVFYAASAPSTNYQLKVQHGEGEAKMNIKQKVVAALSVAALASVPGASGAILSGDAAAERIVLSNRVVLVYNSSGTLKVNKSGVVDVLVVGGGGGGGANSSNFGGGGGGAGGVIYRSSFPVEASDEPYTVTVGAGGTAGTPSVNATIGGDSSVFGLTAYGGGYGAKYGGNIGGEGASGGGGTATNGSPDVPYDGGLAVHGDQGNAGGAAAANRFGSGGGGGAGSAGGGGDDGTPGVGGDGIVCDIVGTNVWYGGGGAGFRKGHSISGGVGGGGSCVKTSSSASTAGAGVDGLGGGGCGGANGGSGVVIFSFELGDSIDDADGFTLFGGDYTIPFLEETAHVFTNSGTLTVTGDGMVEILAVGGGGGGGKGHASNSNYGGAGGGGGGVAHFAALPVAAGTYNIVVGAGGEIDANGGDTKALGVIAFGGGAGAQYDSRSSAVDPAGMIGNDGASGGGTCHASWYPPDGTFDAENVDEISGGSAIYALYGNAGNAGGSSFHQYYPGGGGGAGAPGGMGSSVSPGAGGDGLPVSIVGAEVYYGGGGAGARYNASYPLAVGGLGGGGAIGENGTDGLGGGGSGNRKGGSGVVIIRYRKKPAYAEEFVGAIGGMMRRRSGHCIHTFAADGTFTMPCVGKIEVLLVGGGGGGGANGSSYGGGGGGGGGVVYTNIVAVAGEHRISIGAGGGVGENGGNSSAFGLVAYGGGYGADSYEGSNPTDIVGKQGGNGASGGGATHTRYGSSETMPGGEASYAAKGNRGHAGGGAGHVFGPGGGGGAGGVGETVSGTVPGAGGEGWTVDITGSMVCYGGGGAGFRKGQSISGGVGGGGSCVKTSSSASTAGAGVDGLGGGGCGGANGGSGVVIVRYKLPYAGTVIIFR